MLNGTAQLVKVTVIVFADGRSVFFESNPIHFNVYLAQWRKSVSPTKLEEYRKAGATNGSVEIMMLKDEFMELHRRNHVTLVEEREKELNRATIQRG
jgi:hypothetical protein